MNQLITPLRKVSGKSTPIHVRHRSLQDVASFLKTINEIPLKEEGNFEAWLGMLAAPFSQLSTETSGILLEVQNVLLDLGLFFPLR